MVVLNWHTYCPKTLSESQIIAKRLANKRRSKVQVLLSVIGPQLRLPVMTKHMCRAFAKELQSTVNTSYLCYERKRNHNQKIHRSTRWKKINHECQVKKSSNNSYCEAHTCFGLLKFPSANCLIAEESLKRVQRIKLLRKINRGLLLKAQH